MSYGVLCILAGAKLTPALLKRYNARDFTTITNLTNAFAFFLRGSAPKSTAAIRISRQKRGRSSRSDGGSQHRGGM